MRGRGESELQEGASLRQKPDQVLQKMQQLNSELLHHKDLYYNGEAIISDAEYDGLERELEDLKLAHPDLAPEITDKDPDATLLVGAAPRGNFPKVKHDKPMLSLDKVHNYDDLQKFLDKHPNSTFEGWYKFDGVSLSLVYKDGKLDRAATRGDGVVGDVITENARRINGVLSELKEKIDCEIRGEVIMKKSDWAQYNQNNPEKPFANPRNAVSGSMRLKDAKEVAKRPMTFIAYDVIEKAGGETHQRLESLGFDLISYQEIKDFNNAKEYIEEVEKTRSNLDYEIDGIVMRISDKKEFENAGYTSKFPKGAMAYKMTAEEGQSELQSVIWQVGKSGIISPVANIKPLFLAGTTIRRVTLHNMEIVRERDIQIGDKIKIKRAGDVIPHVIGPVLEERKNTRKIEIPEKCPSCGSSSEEDDSGVVRCTNPLTCPAQNHRRLIHWGSRGGADIDALGENWLQKFEDSGLIKKPSDIYRISREDLLGKEGTKKEDRPYEGMGEKLADKLLKSIDDSKGLGLRRALISLSIPYASEGTAKRLCRAGYTTIEEVQATTPEQLSEVEDVGPVVAESIHEFLNKEETKKEIQALRDLGVNLDVLEEDKPVKNTGSALAGKTVVITGTLEGIGRKEMEKRVENAGAKSSGSVSKNTDYLVCGENAGSKKAKAEKLGVKVLTQSELEKML